MDTAALERVRAASIERLNFVRDREHDLLIAIRDWRRTYPFELRPVVDDDGMGWKAVLRIKSEPPLTRWGLAASEILNHLRSVLNTTLHRLVTAEGLILHKPRLLQFPFAETYDKWGKGEGARVAELPDAVQRFTYLQQPFVQQAMFPGERTEWLTALFRLDNQGKHQTELVASPGHSEFAGSFRAILRDAPEVRPDFPRIVHARAWIEGAVFEEERTEPYHVLDFRGEFDWLLHVMVVGANGEEVNLAEELTLLHNLVTCTVHGLVDAWGGILEADAFPPAGDPNYRSRVKPIEGSAFKRAVPDIDDHGPERLWAPHQPAAD